MDFSVYLATLILFYTFEFFIVLAIINTDVMTIIVETYLYTFVTVSLGKIHEQLNRISLSKDKDICKLLIWIAKLPSRKIGAIISMVV